MGQPHFAAVCAWHQLAGCKRIVRPAAITSTFRNFSFWKRGHNLTPKNDCQIHRNTCQ
jgi:hypothetical protein